MEQPLSESEIEQLLSELHSDRAKRRWSTVQKLATLEVDDERIAVALEAIAFQDPMQYVREEAQAALRRPTYEAVLQRRKEEEEVKRQAEQAKFASPQAVASQTETSTVVTCPNCKYQNPRGLKLCHNCGFLFA